MMGLWELETVTLVEDDVRTSMPVTMCMLFPEQLSLLETIVKENNPESDVIRRTMDPMLLMSMAGISTTTFHSATVISFTRNVFTKCRPLEASFYPWLKDTDLHSLNALRALNEWLANRPRLLAQVRLAQYVSHVLTRVRNLLPLPRCFSNFYNTIGTAGLYAASLFQNMTIECPYSEYQKEFLFVLSCRACTVSEWGNFNAFSNDNTIAATDVDSLMYKIEKNGVRRKHVPRTEWPFMQAFRFVYHALDTFVLDHMSKYVVRPEEARMWRAKKKARANFLALPDNGLLNRAQLHAIFLDWCATNQVPLGNYRMVISNHRYGPFVEKMISLFMCMRLCRTQPIIITEDHSYFSITAIGDE